eukprot:scaffold9191_cov114-Cylindrotheca_fusiformis.AAC.20
MKGAVSVFPLFTLIRLPQVVTAFSTLGPLSQRHSSFLNMGQKTKILEKETTFFDPFDISSRDAMAGTGAVLSALTILPTQADAVTMPQELSANFDPGSFVPVCGASDNFYRLLQGSAEAVVGSDNFKEYGPLIASGLLRVRLELCVVESFFNEAVGPFIRENGLSWVLPVHETVETFLAGTVFAIATTFILVGSTKILTVIFTFADFFLGTPMRVLGNFFFDRARGRPVTFDIGFGPFKTRIIGPKDLVVDESKKKFDYSVDMSKTELKSLPAIIFSGVVKAGGQAVGLLREVLDAIDLFVGKSLILWATAYVGHIKKLGQQYSARQIAVAAYGGRSRGLEH